MLHSWISATVEGDENVKRDKTIDFVALLNTWNCWIRYDVKRLEYWICYIVDIVWTVDWDMIMKVNNTTEFVTLLCVGLLNGMRLWN